MDRNSRDPARILDSSEIWDPETGAWSQTGPLAETRWGASTVTLTDGRVLVVGGVASNESAPTQRQTAEVYDPTTGLWSSAGSLTMGRAGFALAALPDGALVMGGLGGSGLGWTPYLATVERFDPTSSTW